MEKHYVDHYDLYHHDHYDHYDLYEHYVDHNHVHFFMHAIHVLVLTKCFIAFLDHSSVLSCISQFNILRIL